MRALLVIALFFIIFYSFSSLAFAQNATNETNQPKDLCANVKCESPPASFCRDEKTFVKYSSPGTCESSSGQCKYSEQSFECSKTSTTCPDGFVASCQQVCDAATGCKSCTPSCVGHEKAACPAAPTQPACSSGTTLTKKLDSQGCVVGYECVQSAQNQTTQTCPQAPQPPACAGELVKKTDSLGCVVGYECKTIATACTEAECGPEPKLPNYVCPDGKTIAGPGRCLRQATGCGWEIISCPTACPAPPGAPSCPSGSAVQKYDEKGCVISYECVSVNATPICTSVYAPVCGADGKTYSNDCFARESGVAVAYRGECGAERKEYCGNNICEAGEENNCPQDCISARETCPVTRTCDDGSTVPCRPSEHGCFCEACPITNLPEGCRQEVDKEKGFVKVVCERAACPAVPNVEEIKSRCEQDKGVFSLRKSPDGCEFPDCRFSEFSVAPIPVLNPLEPEKKCRSETEEQREVTKQNCEKLGLNFVISVHGSCKISKCSSKPQRRGCEPLPHEERQRIENQCRESGTNVIKDFDENGCPLMRCGAAHCTTEIPAEAYERCGNQGGELVIRKDHEGCIAFSQCLVTADVRTADVDPIEKIPESSELLSIAFRMEELRIELDKLARKTDDIADYYASTNSPDEGRYRRVSDMFEAAKDKVEEIKEKLRNAVQSGDIKEDNMIEVKRDIRYIKDVMMKDILYLMLSSSEDAESIGGSRAVKVGGRFEEVVATDDTNCDSDGECFDRAFRLCKKVIFYPEGRRGPKVEVRGLEGDACVMYAVLPKGEGPPAGAIPGINPPYDMTCKIKKYALGVRSPEEDVFPFCEGPMVELMKKFGPGGEAPGVPGKCRGDECRDYCGRGAEQAKECLEHLGPYLPPEAKQGLEQLAQGQGFGSRGEFREGGFREEFREGEFKREFSRPQPGPSGFQPQPAGEACSGCLNNNICDPGECRDCPDCRR